MKRPIDVSCCECGADPLQPCNGSFPYPPFSPEVGFHFARIEAANFENNGASGHVPSAAAFNEAVLKTGLF